MNSLRGLNTSEDYCARLQAKRRDKYAELDIDSARCAENMARRNYVITIKGVYEYIYRVVKSRLNILNKKGSE